MFKKLNFSFKTSMIRKLQMAITLVILLPMLIWGTIYMRIIFRNYSEGQLEAAENAGLQMSLKLDDSISILMKNAEFLSKNEELINIVTYEQTDLYIVTAINDIKRQLDLIKNQNKMVEKIRIIHNNPSTFELYDMMYRDEGIQERIDDIMARYGTKRLSVSNVEYFLQGHNYKYYENTETDMDIWYLYHIINPTELSSLPGFVEIVIDNEALCADLNKYMLDDGNFIALITNNSDVPYISSEQSQNIPFDHLQLSTSTYTVEIDKNQYIAVSNYIENLESSLTIFIKQDNLILFKNQWFMYITVAILLMFGMLGISLLVSRVLLKKLLILNDQINMLDVTDPESKVSVDSYDEIGELAQSFNGILEKLHIAYDHEKELLYSQLTNQLKPHFICNAMDMLRIQAEKKNQQELALSATQINKYFRYSMLYSTKSINILEEVSDALNYLELINQLRQNKITPIVTLDTFTEKYGKNIPVPKLMLQPIIENSVYHGLMTKNSGYISIEISKIENCMQIVISDNGVGMEPKSLAQLKERLKYCQEREYKGKNQTADHIGLENVIKRLKLKDNHKFSLEIESIKNSGTTITIKFEIPSGIINE